MTFVFAYPGYRGGLFHSATALLPWWMVLGLLGLDDAIDWIAARRRTWRPGQAKVIFSVAVLAIAAVLSLTLTRARLSNQPSGGTLIRVAAEVLPPDAVVMATIRRRYTTPPGWRASSCGRGTGAILSWARYRSRTLCWTRTTRSLAPLYDGRDAARVLAIRAAGGCAQYPGFTKSPV